MEGSLIPCLLYTASDAAFVDWLRDFLGSHAAAPNRWLERVWSPGEPLSWDSQLADGYDVLLAVVSEASRNSVELPKAVATAKRNGKAILLLYLEDARAAPALQALPSVSFPGDWLVSLPRLHEQLGAISQRALGSERPVVGVLSSMPHVLPDDQFRDRDVHSETLARKLFSDPVGVMVLSGPEGIGKTAMVARILEALRSGQSWPRWLIYLTADGSVPVSAELLKLLSRVPPLDAAGDSGPLMLDPDLTTVEKFRVLLKGLGSAHVLAVLDNVEDLLDEDDEFRDVDLGEMLEMLAGETQHQHVKALLITRREPRRLRRPGVVKRFPLDDGLESPYAEEFLRALDRDGTLGLKGADATVLGRIRDLTDGNPRALEAFYSVLDRGDTARDELLDELASQQGPPEERTRYLVGRMFQGLAHTEQRLLEALAIYGRPVAAEAVDFLIQPYIRLYRSAPELRVLQRRRLIRADGTGYYLPRSDRERVLAAIDRGRPEDRESPSPPETQLALFSRAADYFEQQRQQRTEEVASPSDLVPELTEIDLRIAAEEYDKALDLLHTVDLEYLRPWGYSQLLIPQRLRLNGNISDQQANLANLDALGNASQQRDELEEAKGYLSQAVALAEELGDPCDLARSYINLGGAYLADYEPSRAVTRFEMALELARQHNLQTEEAHARANLSICYGHMGRLAEAIDQHKRTLEIVEQAKQVPTAELDEDTVDLEEMAVLEVQVLLGIGVLLGRRGEPDDALPYLTRGRQLAQDLGEELFEGELLSASAEVQIDRGEIQKAIELAAAAIEIGKPRRNSELLQDAYSILALAQLEKGDSEGAQTAASAATRYPRRRRLEPFVLAGIVALLNGDRKRGFDTFNWVDKRARRLREQDRHNVSVLDPHGLALCGLTLCGVGDYIQKAAATFRQAREASSSQAGMAHRTLRLLKHMAQADPTGLLDHARAAAAP